MQIPALRDRPQDIKELAQHFVEKHARKLGRNAPTFTPPDNIVTPATSAAGAAVSFTANGSDPENGVIAAVCAPAVATTV